MPTPIFSDTKISSNLASMSRIVRSEIGGKLPRLPPPPWRRHCQLRIPILQHSTEKYPNIINRLYLKNTSQTSALQDKHFKKSATVVVRRSGLTQGRGAVGLTRGAVGLTRGAVGLTRGAVGLTRGAVGLTRGAVGLTRGAVGLTRGAVGLTRGAVGLTREAVGLTRGVV